MSDQQANRKLHELVYRSVVPIGYRPRSDSDIEAMLDTIDCEPLSQQQQERVLRKIKGEEPVGIAGDDDCPASSVEETEAERELAAMFKAEGDEIPPEIQEKLKQMEDEAAKPAEDDDDEGENGG